MSTENVGLARRYVEAFNAGGLDATAPLRHPEIEVIDPPTFPDARRYVGEEEVREAVQGYLELGWDGRFREPEFFDAGEEVLVVFRFMGASAHGGGFPMDNDVSHLYRFADGKLRMLRQYMSREEGLEAAGLT